MEGSRPLVRPSAPLKGLNLGFDALGAGHFAPGLEAFLEGNYPRFGQGDLYGLKDLLLRDPEVQRHSDVALYVPLARSHHREANDEDEFLGFAVEPALFEVG